MIKQQTVDMVGIDLDSPSTYDMLREYFKAKQMFPHAEIKTYISNSGRGYHIEIKKSVTILENFLLRAYFNDCAHRLRYSMQKYLIDKNDKWLDLLFQQKGTGKRKEIDIERSLQSHKTMVKSILKELGSEQSMQKLGALAQELNFLPEEYFIVACEVKGRLEKEELQKFADKTNIDCGYRYKISPNFFPGQGQLLFFWKFNDIHEATKFMGILRQQGQETCWLKKIKTE